MNIYTKSELEKKLDVCVRYSLGALLQCNPASEEFMQIFQENLFVKSNTKAFILVAHYLFTTLDEKEFKKRFYWPIQCKQDENHFRTATVEYINCLIDKGKIKIEKIKATHVVTPRGIKFMKFLLKIIKMVLEEIINRKSDIEVDNTIPIGAYVTQIAEKSELLCKIAVETKQMIASDIAQIKSKSEQLDQVFKKVIDTDIPDGFLDIWSKENIERFNAIKKQQQKLYQCISDFDGINKRAIKLLEPVDFKKPQYDVESAKNAMVVIRDYIGTQMEETEDSEFVTVNGRISCEKIIKLINSFMIHAVTFMNQYPTRDAADINNEASVINEMHAKSVTFLDKLSELRNQFPEKESLNVTASPNIVLDNDLLNIYMRTPPLKVFLKNLEDANGVSGISAKPGSVSRNASQLKILQMSQRQLQYSPKLSRSMKSGASGGNFLQPGVVKRPALVSSAALFAGGARSATNDQNNLSISSRIDSYSMMMPNSGNVLSSTILDNTIRNVSIGTVSATKANEKRLTLSDVVSPIVAVDFDSNSLDSPLQETQIPNILKVATPLKTPKRIVTSIHKTKLSLAQVEPSPSEICTQINDVRITTPALQIEKTMKQATLETNSSATKSQNLTNVTEKNEDSPATLELLSQFNWMNIADVDNKENILETSDPSLINDSI